MDRLRIALYLAFAYGISWLTALFIHLSGGLLDSPEIIPGTGITQALVLIAGIYMTAPALANLLTRAVTREGWQDLNLRPKFRQGWPYWLMAWFGTPLLVMLGGILYFLVFPGNFDRGLTQIANTMTEFEALTGEPAPFGPGQFVVIQLAQAVVIAPVINAIFVLGEEFGWRAYLQQKMMPLGYRRAMVWMGVIWGAWHWPLIAMGHNFGLNYPGAPWTGMLLFTWFTFAVGTFFGWLTLRGRSVWPAVIGHAVLNGVAGAVVFFTIGEPNPLLGPTVAGLVGVVPFSLFALWLFYKGDWSEEM
jgi:membrane protease YdiL (CAAX protease family)